MSALDGANGPVDMSDNAATEVQACAPDKTHSAKDVAPCGKRNDGDDAVTLPAAKVRRRAETAAQRASARNHGAEAADAAHQAAMEAEFAFDNVRKNRVACLSLLCQHAQRIERVWDEDELLRKALLGTFSSCLASLETHKEEVLRDLSRLAPKVGPSATLRHFLTIALPIERQHTRGLRDHEFLVLRPDDLTKADAPAAAPVDVVAVPAPQASRGRMPLTVVLDNLRSAFNVGSIFRTAECLRVNHMHLCGYTATPAESKGQTGRAAMGADVNVPWDHREKTQDVINELRREGVPVFALETVEGAQSVHDFKFPSPCALLLGNERHGLEADVLALCTAPVRIPCHGIKNSLNVGVAFAICGFEVARQWNWSGGEDPGSDGASPPT